MTEQRTNPTALAINGGEWSPHLRGQTNLAGYDASAERLENFIPLVQGPIRRRGGTEYIGDVANHEQRSWLIPFIQRRDITAMLELSPGKMRVYVNRGLVLTGGGAPYEVATPWLLGALQNPGVFFGLSYTQQGNTIFVVDREGNVPPQRIQRQADDSWTITEFRPSGGPLGEMNGTSTTMHVSAATGTGVTITASANVFTAGMVGKLVRIDFEGSDTLYWSADSSTIGAATFVWSDGKEYEQTGGGSGDSGYRAPNHTRGTVSDGSKLWTFRSPGYGIIRITSVTNGTTAVGNVQTRFPQSLVGASFASHYWRLGRWGGADGYPTTVGMYNRRLVFGQGIFVDGSWPDTFARFDLDDAGLVTDECAFSITLAAGLAGEVTEMMELSALVVHTDRGQFLVGPQSNAEPFGPANIGVKRGGDYGAEPARNMSVGPVAFFLPPGGKKLRGASFDLQSEGLSMPNTMVRADHLTGRQASHVLRDIVRQEEPYGLIWARRRDGLLLCLTYEQDQDARAWSRHAIAGEGPAGTLGRAVVEHIAVLPSADGLLDELWMIVRRRINGVLVRYIEIMSQGYVGEDTAPGDYSYFDASLKYSGAGATTITGLGHLEGQTVAIIADGKAHPDRVVTSGAITLEFSAQLVTVGLRAPCYYLGPNKEWQSRTKGTAQGETKRIAKVGFRVLETLGGRGGGNLTEMDLVPDLNDYQAGVAMDGSPRLVSDDCQLLMPTGWEKKGQVAYSNDTGFPVTLVAILPDA